MCSKTEVVKPPDSFNCAEITEQKKNFNSFSISTYSVISSCRFVYLCLEEIAIGQTNYLEDIYKEEIRNWRLSNQYFFSKLSSLYKNNLWGICIEYSISSCQPVITRKYIYSSKYWFLFLKPFKHIILLDLLMSMNCKT